METPNHRSTRSEALRHFVLRHPNLVGALLSASVTFVALARLSG